MITDFLFLNDIWNTKQKYCWAIKLTTVNCEGIKSKKDDPDKCNQTEEKKKPNSNCIKKWMN